MCPLGANIDFQIQLEVCLSLVTRCRCLLLGKDHTCRNWLRNMEKCTSTLYSYYDMADRARFTMKFGTTYWVILNSQRVASELLEKRAAIYSSRPALPMAHSLASGGKRILVMPYGDLWRRERKIMHQILANTKRRIFEPFQDIESRALLYEYLHEPDLWPRSHHRYANSVIMSVVFGRRTSLKDPYLLELLHTSEQFVRYLMPARSVVDVFPFLAKIPWLKTWQPWRWYGDELYRRTRNVYKREIDNLRQRQKLGIQKPCFMTEFFDAGKDMEFSDEEVYFISGTLMEAGSDTTRVSLHEILAGAALYPDWIERARMEIDKSERQSKKAYVGSKPAIAETGIPHALTRDDEFEGYHFPAGTVFTWNHWGISNAASEYEQPERFWPERFINDELDMALKGHLGLGAGRRACVGYSVGVDNLAIAIARLVYCFDFEQDPSAPIDVSKPFFQDEDGYPFKVIIKPRSEAHRDLVERECSAAAVIQ
ncbi:hypothetical protein CLAIMM_08436 [Cladophialophora immunda]|nr:hypothetical protein CLAIMM_08436 [Cladophialophora immunda]